MANRGLTRSAVMMVKRVAVVDDNQCSTLVNEINVVERPCYTQSSFWPVSSLPVKLCLTLYTLVVTTFVLIEAFGRLKSMADLSILSRI